MEAEEYRDKIYFIEMTASESDRLSGALLILGEKDDCVINIKK